MCQSPARLRNTTPVFWRKRLPSISCCLWMLPAVFVWCAEMGRVFAPAGLLRIGERVGGFQQILGACMDATWPRRDFWLCPSVSLSLERAEPTLQSRPFAALLIVQNGCEQSFVARIHGDSV